MSSARDDSGPIISTGLVRDLAAAGALCESCGGMCVPTITVAILALNAAREVGFQVPWCVCAECPACRPFHEAVVAHAASRGEHDFKEDDYAP